MTRAVSPHPLRLAPSILAADHACLVDGLQKVEALPIEWLHLDIMDGHFVPNLSFGPQTVAALRERNRDLLFDTHLMLANPHEHVEAFAKAGANLISIHVEPDYPVAETLQRIRAYGCRTGLVLNPATPAAAATPFLEAVDLILVMTVWPGFGGQSFLPETLGTMSELHKAREETGLSFRLEVDGGIDLATASECRRHGADTFVAGTAFFKAPHPQAFFQAIQEPEAD
ncbi:MAG: ribulose-phosphate 3-epimerase [Verrucomicrobia bacterium]|jgi:ribulose-phosphate 3-epimerase|nr:ribulose-phosphate 3-epimerase [Verrucomicrobiota bacterium]